MADFEVTVTIRTADGRTLTATRNPTIPPDYAERDIKHFYALHVEATAHDLIEEQNDPDWVPTFKRAAILNDIRLTIIERLARRWATEGPERAEVAAEIQALLVRPDAEILAAADGPVEE